MRVPLTRSLRVCINPSYQMARHLRQDELSSCSRSAGCELTRGCMLHVVHYCLVLRPLSYLAALQDQSWPAQLTQLS